LEFGEGSDGDRVDGVSIVGVKRAQLKRRRHLSH
jgi:hypothetical protein